MTCERVEMPGGGFAIICSSRRRQRCKCGRVATLACDWKVTTRRSGTCDAPICSSCSTRPTPDKDLCQAHGEAFRAWQAKRQATAPVDGLLL